MTDVAFACGFTHISAFNTLFRERFGASPAEFRTPLRLASFASIAQAIAFAAQVSSALSFPSWRSLLRNLLASMSGARLASWKTPRRQRRVISRREVGRSVLASRSSSRLRSED